MRYFDKDDAAKIKAEQWQLDLLRINPDYVSWGPHEDYMMNVTGWREALFFASWKDFGPWGLDYYNECVNFYFEVDRESKECPVCKGNGYHKNAQDVVNTFYSFTNDKGVSWCNKITEDELAALIQEKRIPPNAVLQEVNDEDYHDAINRNILIKTRLARLGLPLYCDTCGADGRVYTANEAHVSLVLWMLHPRKGASRGVEVSRITQDDLPAIFAWLKQAKDRNADRFGKLPA